MRQPNSIDLSIGGDLGMHIINGDESLPEIEELMKRRNSLERHRLSSRFGINYYHGIGQRISLKSGIRYANPGFSISSIEEIDLEQNINSINKSYQHESQGGFQYEYKYQMLAVPVGLKYMLSKNSFGSYLELGVSTYFYHRTLVEKSLFQGEGNQLLSQESIFIEEPISQFNFFGFISCGSDFPIWKNLHGFSQIIVRYQINELRPESLIEEKMIILGLELGVRYVFIK